MSDKLKQRVGREVVKHVKSGMKLGIGTGSTAEAFVHALAPEVEKGLDIVGVPTSERTAKLCLELGIALTTLEECSALDLTIDGADEIDGDHNLIKGGGGALLREKIVAAASDQMFVIADETKMVEILGAYPLPIEINRFGMAATQFAIEKAAQALGLSGEILLREDENSVFITDGGHYILDASFGLIRDASALSRALLEIPGVVQHGLFLGMADKVFLGCADGVVVLEKEI